MKAFLIARVSTDEQSDALPGQVYRLEDYAKKKGFDYELFQIKESAYRGKRTSFKKIIERIQQADDSAIVVLDKIDRYTRDSNSDEVALLNSMCRLGLIQLHFPSDNLFINKDSSAQEKFMLNVGISNAQYYSDSSADNVNRRIQQKLRDGEVIGRVPMGYKNIRNIDGKSDVIVDPFSAEAVKEAFETYAKGIISLSEIKKLWAVKYGIYKEKNTIAKLLHNPFYCGYMKHRDKSYTHKYPKLVSKTLFEQVQMRIKDPETSKKKWAGVEFNFRGLVKCYDCGSRITFERHKGKYVYGKCSSKYGIHKTAYVPEFIFEEHVGHALSDIHIPDDVMHQIHDVLANEAKDEQDRIEKTRTSLQAEILKYQNRKENMYVDKLDGFLSEKSFKEKYEEFTKKEDILKERLENLELTTKNSLSDISHLLHLANKAPILFQKANNLRKREISNLIFSNLLLQQKELRWEYNKPFDTMAYCNKTGNWCGLGDSNSWPLPWQGSALTTELNPHDLNDYSK